jgi:bifunctional UDP-N-acetylglucosamine pyrophosphorylase/glucosamine-1-phosphate N-acetyltransferase
MIGKAIVLIHGGGGGAACAPGGDRFSCLLLGRPLVSYVVAAAAGVSAGSILLALNGGDRKSAAAQNASALLGASSVLRRKKSWDLLLVPADRPLVQSRTLKRLLALHRREGSSMTIMSCGPDLEQDSVAVFRVGNLVPLWPALARAKGRTGLRFVSSLLSARGKKVVLTENSDSEETLRVCSPADVARAARILRQRKNEHLSRRGVTLLDPQSTWIDWAAEIGSGTVVYPSVVIEGASRIGKNCRIYPHVHIMGSHVGDRVKVLSSTVLEDCRLENDAQVGPFSRLRPGTVVRASSKVGNFVEMKNTVFGPRSKAQHLSYLGDSLVEEDVNIGAGTITCNYDGVRKSRTHIEAGAFIGSGTELVAPVKVGKQAYVAAGSTITKDVGPASLAIGRARQVEKPGWVIERIRALQRKGRTPK